MGLRTFKTLSKLQNKLDEAARYAADKKQELDEDSDEFIRDWIESEASDACSRSYWNYQKLKRVFGKLLKSQQDVAKKWVQIQNKKLLELA